MRQHAENAPSDAERWLNCAGAINLTRKMGDRSSFWAAEGTAAHRIRQECLELGFDAWHFVGRKSRVEDMVFEWTDEDADLLQPGIDRIREFSGRMVVEHKVDTTPYVGRDSRGRRQFGTLDCGIIGRRLIVISDLKWGSGVPVEAVGNAQQQIYALSFWKEIAKYETDAEEFLIIIDQPRCAGGGGEWRVSLDELLDFGDYVRRRAEASRDPDAERTPGPKQCQWCPASKVDGMCPEFEAWQLSIPGITFEDLDAAEASEPVKPEPIEGITPRRRTQILRAWPLFTKWIERLHAEALADALAGDYAPGLKAIAGRRGKRVWRDEREAEDFLLKHIRRKEDIYTEKIISPFQAEKLLPHTALVEGKVPRMMVEQSEPKPVLVSADDERPAVRNLDVEFEDFTNEQTD